MKRTNPLLLGNLPRETRVRELGLILARYDKFSSNRAFAKDCRTFDRIDAGTDVGDRLTAEAVVAFYQKWGFIRSHSS